MQTSLRQLLASIVDYAGIFPPAQLSLFVAMQHYQQAQSSPHSEVLQRFVIPATRVSELAQQLAQFSDKTSVMVGQPDLIGTPPDLFQGLSSNSTPGKSSKPWSLSVIVSQHWQAELDQMAALINVGASKPNFSVDAFEVAPLPLDEISLLSRHLPAHIPAYFEIPWTADLESYLAVLKGLGRAAKLRMGGVTVEAFPDSHQLSDRILSFARSATPFKATAGLHHPLRGCHPLTYQPDSDTATMHGFLNVVLLAAFAAQSQITQSEAVALLEERAIAAFQFSDEGVRWGDRFLSLTAITQARQRCFHSFGSCSFQEPLDDLHTLNLL